eukprot:216132_1
MYSLLAILTISFTLLSTNNGQQPCSEIGTVFLLECQAASTTNPCGCTCPTGDDINLDVCNINGNTDARCVDATCQPTQRTPTAFPTNDPTETPTESPTTRTPTAFPTNDPTEIPTQIPTEIPTTLEPS